MKLITVLRRLAPGRVAALLCGTTLLVIVMAGLTAHLGAPPTSAKAASSDPLSWYDPHDPNKLSNDQNHPVMHDPHVFLLFEGQWADSGMQAVKQYFLDVNGSSFEGILTQYSDSSGPIPNTLKFSGSVMDTTIFHSDTCGKNTIVDNGLTGDINDEIANAVSFTDDSTIYFVFTPKGYSFYADDKCSSSPCGLHGKYFLGGIIYAVIPWGGGSCNSDFPPGTDPVQIDINTASHEQFEAITDPSPDLAPAWRSGTGEIGDKCSGEHPEVYLNGHTYPDVQGEYDNASQMCLYPAPPPSPAAYLERAGGTVVSGWACDNANRLQTSWVDFYADAPYGQGGTFLGSAQANGYRPDLVSAGVCGSTAYHGFTFDASAAGGGQHTIWAYNIVNGTVTTVGNSGNVSVSVSMSPPSPAAYLDTAAGGVVSGWACDNANRLQTSRVDFYANAPYGQGGTFLGSAQANGYRPDLVSAGVCGGTAYHGFTFDASAAGGGQHTIWAYNIVSGTVTTVGNSGNVTVSFSTGQPSPAAYMVQPGGTVINGWACDNANSAQTSRVDFYADAPYGQGGIFLGSAQANGYRPDLVSAGVCGSTAYHGFSFDARGVGGGQHTIWAYNIVSGTVTTVGNSGNVTVNVPECKGCTLSLSSPSAAASFLHLEPTSRGAAGWGGMTRWLSGAMVSDVVSDFSLNPGTMRRRSTTTLDLTEYSANWMVNETRGSLLVWSSFTMTDGQIDGNGPWVPITDAYHNETAFTNDTGKKLATPTDLGPGNTSFGITFNARR